MLEVAPLLLAAALGALLVAAASGVVALAMGAVSSHVEPPAAAAAPAGSSAGAALGSRAAALASPAATLQRLSGAAIWAALAAISAALALRALATGHAPWSNMYEVSQAFAGATLVAYLLLARTFPLAGLAPAVAAVAALLLAHAISLPSVAEPLVPALQQPALLTVHVAAAIAAYGIYAVALAAAVAELVQRGRAAVSWLPAASVCRAAAHRSVVIGYPVLTAAIVLGAVWANLAWRSYWNNDPKELTAAATWLIYGAYLHVAGRRDRWGALAPWLIVAGFGGVLLTYFGANLLFPGQHSYTGL